MKRSEKEQIVSAMKERVLRSKSLFFADFTGITVEQVNELRREFRKSDIGYQVVKNTLARKALEGFEGYEVVLGKLENPTAIAFGYGDPVAPARIIKKFREKHNKLKVKACVVENQVFQGEDFDKIARLPSRADLIAGILGSIEAPIAGLIGAVGAVMRDLVTVIDAIEKKKAA